MLQYLGRYTHRVAISNHRLISFAEGKVTFRWRDSAHHNEQKLLTLSLDEFLRRFLLHVLPKGFVRIRNFGFLANRRRATTLPLCFPLLGAAPAAQPQISAPWSVRSLALPPMRWAHDSHRTIHGCRNATPLSPPGHGCRMRRRSTSRIRWVSRHSQSCCVFSGNTSVLLTLHAVSTISQLASRSRDSLCSCHPFALRCADPATVSTAPSIHSIPIGPASAATTGGFVQTALSNARRAPRTISLVRQNARPIKR